MTNATLSVTGSKLGSALSRLLMTDEIVPGTAASYQLCKEIYTYHPLGMKMADSPIRIAQSQAREITLAGLPGLEARLREQFQSQWEADNCDRHIFNVMRLSRVYGLASLCMVSDDMKPLDAIDFKNLWKMSVSYNVLDPLNTAGSLVLNQMPNATDYQKVTGIAINGVPYHRSRAVVIMNEDPIYIEYTSSAFGYVGRSVYQRALFPLKSFIQSMVTDDMVTRKAGIIVAALKAAGSIIDNMMMKMGLFKRDIIKEAETNNVISIGEGEEIKAIDLTNVDAAHDGARKHVIENIATAADMPAVLLNQESFAEGFGEGTEDAKAVAKFIDRVRVEMRPLYAYFDQITMARAWNPEFFAALQADFAAELAGKTHETAFIEWQNNFRAIWPSLLTEPDSEKITVEDVKLRAVIAAAEVMLAQVDPTNAAKVIEWLCDVFNDQKMLFGSRLELDLNALVTHLTDKAQRERDAADKALQAPNAEGSFKPRADAVPNALHQLGHAVAQLPPPRSRQITHAR